MTALSTAAQAIAGVRERYEVVGIDGGNLCQIRDWEAANPVDSIAHHGTRAECQAWIDREAARACLLSVLPVSDDGNHKWSERAATITGYIQHIVNEGEVKWKT